MARLATAAIALSMLVLGGCARDTRPALNHAEARACDAAMYVAFAESDQTEPPRQRIAAIRSYLAQHPQSAPAALNLGAAYYLTGRYQDALDCANRVPNTDPKLAPAHVLRAAALRRLGRASAASAEIQRGMATVPDGYDGTLWGLMRMLLVSSSDDWRVAQQIAGERIASGKPTGDLIEAGVHFQRGEYRQAIQAADRAQASDKPDSFMIANWARSTRALAHTMLGDPSDWSREGCNLTVGPAPWLALALEAERAGKWGDARLYTEGSYLLPADISDMSPILPAVEVLAERLIAGAQARDNADALIVRGLAAAMLGRNEEARQALVEAAGLAPSDPAAQALGSGRTGRDAMDIDMPRIRRLIPNAARRGL